MTPAGALAEVTRAAALAAFAAFALGTVSGCARTLPQDRSAASLYRDLQRLVAIQDAAGWHIDRYEIDDLMPDVLMSLCRVEPRSRAALVAWLDTRIADLGGPVERAYRHRGKRKRSVSELIELTRIRLAAARGIAEADADCPFWVEPEPEFRGRQISDDSWQITLGGGGKGILVSRGGTRDLQFGGSGRAMIGRNVGSRLGLMIGLDAGASASFPKDDDGGRAGLVFAVDTVVPLVVRYWMVNTYAEIEAGYLARVTEDDLGAVEPGFHVGVAFGGRASRVRWFFPGAVFGVAYEQTFPDQGEPLHMLKVGFRAAIDLDW